METNIASRRMDTLSGEATLKEGICFCRIVLIHRIQRIYFLGIVLKGENPSCNRKNKVRIANYNGDVI